MADHPFDLDSFLAEGLTARIATNGPAVRPVQALRLGQSDPEVPLIIDVAELDAVAA